MSYYLTENQKELARVLVKAVREGRLTETFTAEWDQAGKPNIYHSKIHNDNGALRDIELANFGKLSALVEAKLLIVEIRTLHRNDDFVSFHSELGLGIQIRYCTFIQLREEHTRQ